MLHPSYSDLMKVVNSDVEPGEAPIVNSRYSIVMATSKRARQLIAGEDALVGARKIKPLSLAVEELNQGKIKILTEEEARRAREVLMEPQIDLGEEFEENTEVAEK
ncbi:MAG: DNA-directed RNA polymerase subunit omega [Lachnospiraceae bacterium]|nr:DNA-directed RNA polymerase subunit omega [Lachnospiraceae bacterium]